MKLSDFIGETTEYDKKEMLEERKPRSWLKSVSAFANGSAYVRVGNESIPADAATLKQLVLRGSGKHYDSLPSPYKMEDYAFTKLRSVYRIRSGKELEDSDFISFGLVDEDGMLTNGGALLADDTPLRHSRLFCTRWYGLDKASGIMDALDDKEFGGSLVSLLQNGEEFVKNNTKKRWKKTGHGRLEMPEYPEQAVLESIVNALIHRDYMETGSEVHIDIFDDRMEIYSPGGMYDGSIVQELDTDNIPSRRRNPVIADIFSRMHYMERRGSGFKKIKSDYHNAVNYRPEMEPKFRSTNNAFFVTLYNLNYNVPIKKAGFIEEEQRFYAQETGHSEEKQDIAVRKTGHSNGKQDIQVRISNIKAGKVTKENIWKLYQHFGDDSVFSRADVLEIIGITASPASELLRKIRMAGLIDVVRGQGKGKYKFF